MPKSGRSVCLYRATATDEHGRPAAQGASKPMHLSEPVIRWHRGSRHVAGAFPQIPEKIGGAAEAQPAVKPAIRPGRPNPGGVHAFRKVAFGRRTSPVSLCGSPFKNNICGFFRPETVWLRSTQRHPAPSSNSPEGKFPPCFEVCIACNALSAGFPPKLAGVPSKLRIPVFQTVSAFALSLKTACQ